MKRNEVVVTIKHGGDCSEVAAAVQKLLEASHLCYSTSGRPQYKITSNTKSGDSVEIILQKQ